jgi:hypothetical protein
MVGHTRDCNVVIVERLRLKKQGFGGLICLSLQFEWRRRTCFGRCAKNNVQSLNTELETASETLRGFSLRLLLLLLLLLFLTAIGFSSGGSSLTPVQTPKYNNTCINRTAQIANAQHLSQLF